MFNSVLGSKMERYLELRAPMVSVTVTRHDRKILSSLDQFLVDNDYHETELTEDLLPYLLG
jgi:hypothetical protein